MSTPNEQIDGHDADLSAADNLIESLRQQLSELQGMREEVVHYQKEFHRIRDQLSDHIKREVMLRDRAQRLIDNADWKVGGMLSDESPTKDIPSRAGSWVKTRHLASLRNALAATDDLSSVILCNANPVASVVGEFKGNFAALVGWVPPVTQLYDAWEPK